MNTVKTDMNAEVNEFGDPIHRLSGKLLRKRVNVDLVGVGGTGSQVLTALARLHLAMLAVGHPAGLHVRAYDPDTVSNSNVGRQLFYPADVGRAKSDVLVNRVNLCFGLEWESIPGRYEVLGGRRYPHTLPDILITCVDTASARREIGWGIESTALPPPEYWLDMGNEPQQGQVYLTQPASQTGILAAKHHGDMSRDAIVPLPGRLPNLQDIHPDIFKQGYVEDNRPSCSLAEALEEQDLFINQQMATWGMQILWTLFRHGSIEFHGYIINLQAGRVVPVRVPGQAKRLVTTGERADLACLVGGTNG